MIRIFAVLAIALSLGSNTLASGERELELTPQRISEFLELMPEQVSTQYRYIGRYQQWELFGETLTSTDGDMPFSSTYGYRVIAETIEVVNGRTIKLDQTPQWVHVDACPVVLSVTVTTQTSVVVINKTDKPCL